MYKINCVICDNLFESIMPHAKACSTKCRKQILESAQKKSLLKRTNIVKFCETCNKEFKTYRTASRYCSRTCNRAGGSDIRVARQTVNCKNCFKEIILTINEKKLCCSKECRRDFVKNKPRKNPPSMIICKNCSISFEVPYYHKDRLFCSKSCAAIHTNLHMTAESYKKISETKKRRYATGEIIHPWIGRKHTDETKQKISIVHKESGKSAGRNNPMYEKRNELCPNFGRKHSKESIEKMSEQKSNEWLDGKYNSVNFNSFYKRGNYYSIKLEKQIFYRSSWEKIAFNFLDSCDNIISYINEPFSLVYEYNGKRKYIPDILLIFRDGSQKLVEIKPQFQLSQKKNVQKFEAAEQYCKEKGMIFEVWTEKEIKEMKQKLLIETEDHDI